MTFSLFAARASIGAAALALIALAALHILKPDVHPSQTMISQYALGRYGWVMDLCFAAFAASSLCLLIALGASAPSILSRVGLGLLLVAALGLAMAACFPMDPVSTPPEQMSFSGKMHGLSFLIALPSMAAAVLLLSLALGRLNSHPTLPLLGLTSVIWLSFAIVLVIMLMVGPGKPPDPAGPERFLGLPNRLSMAAYGLWLILAAWPMVVQTSQSAAGR